MNNRNVFYSLLFLITTISLSSCTISPSPKQYAVESDFFSGEMTVHEGPGVKDAFNVLDGCTYYDKVDGYSFIKKPLPIRFANNNVGSLKGSTDYRLPSGESKILMTDIEENYEGQAGVENELIRSALTKAAFNSGQFMNIFDALAKNRSYLMDLIFDQANFGQYQVTFKEETIVDVATGEEKVIKVSDRIPCTDGDRCIRGYKRTEQSALMIYGIELFNFTIEDLTPSPSVKVAIDEQLKRSNRMEELSIEAREAQVRAATTAQNAKAKVAEEESLRDIAVAQAQKKTAVAQEELLQKKAQADAEFYSRQKEAEADKLKVQAGLSPERLAYWEYKRDSVISANTAKAPVPGFIMGGNNGSTLENTYGMERAMILYNTIQKKDQ